MTIVLVRYRGVYVVISPIRMPGVTTNAEPNRLLRLLRIRGGGVVYQATATQIFGMIDLTKQLMRKRGL